MSKKITNTFENLLSKYRLNGLSQVVDFLQSRARRSSRTAFAYSFALDHFNNFIEQKYSGYNIQTILKPLSEKPSPTIDVYVLLDKFVSYLHNDTTNGKDLSPISVKLYMAAVKSYLTYNDIELAPNRFNRRVTMPRIYREDEEAIDVKDIRQILLACNNRRLKAYLLVLASGGMRATEALAIRLRDLDFTTSPTKVHIRKEFAKTRVARDIYISDEATKYLKQWIEWKYRERKYEIKKKVKSDDDTVFSIVTSSKDPHALYTKVLLEFQKVLEAADLKLRKEGGVYKRRKITFHSFRRFVKSTLSDQVGFDFSEYILGHSSKSVYYTKKEPERRSIYANKCMKYFTYLDYAVLEAKGKSIESKVEAREQEIEQLKQQLEQRDTANAETIAKMQEQLTQLQEHIPLLHKFIAQGHQGIESSEMKTRYVESFVKDMVKNGSLDKEQAKAWLDRRKQEERQFFGREYYDNLPPNVGTSARLLEKVVFQKEAKQKVVQQQQQQQGRKDKNKKKINNQSTE